jgi:dolichol-phosphate mannosyltransferase
MLIISLVLGTIALYQKIIGVALSGFTTMIVVQLFSGSVIMISMGIIGYYIAKIYEECKGRPRYIISEICGEKSTDSKGLL